MGIKPWATTNSTVWTAPSGSIVTGLVDADNPQGIRPYTIRFQFDDSSYDPTNESWVDGSFWVQVSSSPNVWDFTYASSIWGPIFISRFQDRNNIVRILGGNLSGVESVGGAFRNCTALRSVSTLDLGTATDISYLFANCSALNSVASLNTASATNMQGIFTMCVSLTTVPLFDTSKVTSMADVFSGCASLTTVPLFDTSKVTSMNRMFTRCLSLATAPLFDTSKVTTMATMFQHCTSLTTVPLYNTVNVTNVSYMFSECYNVESGALSLYQQMSSQVLVPETHTHCFEKCGRDTVSGAAELAQIPSDWK